MSSRKGGGKKKPALRDTMNRRTPYARGKRLLGLERKDTVLPRFTFHKKEISLLGIKLVEAGKGGPIGYKGGNTAMGPKEEEKKRSRIYLGPKTPGNPMSKLTKKKRGRYLNRFERREKFTN